MSRRRALWYILPSLLSVLILALLIPSWLSLRHIAEANRHRMAADLTDRAYALEPEFHVIMAQRDSVVVDSLCRSLAPMIRGRVSAFLLNGELLGDSDDRGADPVDQAHRPEVKAARLGKVGTDVRYNRALDQKLMYVAVPVPAGAPMAIIRLAAETGDLDASLVTARNLVLMSGLLLALVAVYSGILISRRMVRPLEELRTGVVQFGRGELSQKIIPSGWAESADLADALNDMAQALDQRIRSITRRQNEQEAVLAGMIEGVLAVDADERLINLNGAAAQLLRLKRDSAIGRTVQEVVRNAELLRLITRTLNSRVPVEGEFVLTEPEERFIQVHGAQLPEAEGGSAGAVVVLHDITTLRKLENIRREFVANVSHELKTPITSIKGFVETLKDGAIENGEDARRFLEIIEKQADRLNSIIEDLLTLSRIEQGADKAEIYLEERPVREVVEGAIDMCRQKAADKQLTLEATCSDGLLARINAPLLEQALVNLIDNAIKYSEAGKRISVRTYEQDLQVLIEVQDEGSGISAEHLPRLWERFYRVDRARSRAAGGTGLGLAIVKHIVLAHGGTVSVESTPGRGSTFRMQLPSAKHRPW